MHFLSLRIPARSQGCYNSSAPEGSVFSVQFVVFNKVFQMASATRLLTIAPPCDGAAQNYCGGVCTALSCADYATLNPPPPPPPPPRAPPTLTLLGPSTLVVAYAGAEGAAPGAAGAGAVTPRSIEPCASVAATAWPACGAQARDAVDGDLSARVSVSQVLLTDTAFACMPADATAGRCLPVRSRFPADSASHPQRLAPYDSSLLPWDVRPAS